MAAIDYEAGHAVFRLFFTQFFSLPTPKNWHTMRVFYKSLDISADLYMIWVESEEIGLIVFS